MLLLHGFLEHAHVWDFVAPRLASAGYHVFALDWRGHGDSQWIGPGGYYHFADYTADLAFIVRELGGSVALVAHSMGGGAAVQYAGTEPERVWALVLIEGLNVPDSDPNSAPERFANWVQDVDRLQSRERGSISLDDATARIRERFPRFSSEIARHMAEHGTRAEGETRVWKFDPLHQTRSPQPYYIAQARAFWRRVACPALYVSGSESDFQSATPDLAARLAVLRAKQTIVEGSGHHPHLEKPEHLARVLVEFLERA